MVKRPNRSKPAAQGTMSLPQCRRQARRLASSARRNRSAPKVLVAAGHGKAPGGFELLCLHPGFGGQPRWPAQQRVLTARLAYEARRPSLPHRADASLRSPEDRSRTRGAASGLGPDDLQRDVRDLQLAGQPIEGEAGVGYVRCAATFDLPPLMFTPDEVTALVLGARMVQAWGGTEMVSSAGCCTRAH